MVSLAFALSGISSGTKPSAFITAFVSSGMSGLADSGICKASAMCLQHVSTISLAVPIAKAGSWSIAASMRVSSWCIHVLDSTAAVFRIA